MSLTEDQITAQNFKDFFNIIKPYLNNTTNMGFTPVGTIISVMGKTAPNNYLSCEGQVVNISDYPELANYFTRQFEQVNYFGGDGVSTFGIPDLRGEFLRGAGTNSHVDQGNGSNVGEHQDGTLHFRIGANNSSGNVTLGLDAYPDNTGYYPSLINWDAVSSKYVHTHTYVSSSSASANQKGLFTSKPTNTSVLYCIATKNIYVDAKYDYSFDEKVVGTWIDGKPLYQKTFTGITGPSSGSDVILTNLPEYVVIHNYSGTVKEWPIPYYTDANWYCVPRCDFHQLIVRNGGMLTNCPVVVTIQYTKTTD